MKINNFATNTYAPQFQGEKQPKVNKQSDDDMIVLCNSKPLDFPYSAYNMRNNPIVSSTFRDDELFDTRRDAMDYNYKTYDEDDMLPNGLNREDMDRNELNIHYFG